MPNAIAPHVDGTDKHEIDAHGEGVAPGFMNMVAHPEAVLFADGRALTDLAQGVTLEVIGELSRAAHARHAADHARERQGDIRYAVTWRTLGEYMATWSGTAPRPTSPPSP